MRVVDLFSGCGGLSLGFKKAGFKIVKAFDNWDFAAGIYKKNFNHPIDLIDISKEKSIIPLVKKASPDLIMGGPPCQDFSSAGKRDTSLGRAQLTKNFSNIVCAVKPSWFLMENVEQIKKSQLIDDIIIQFVKKGYRLSSVILNAAYCGVPQSRTRFFLIGCLYGAHNSLNIFFEKKMSKKLMTVREYLGDSLEIDFYYRHPRNYDRRGIFSIDEPSPTIRGVNRPIPDGYKLNSCDPKGISLKNVRPLTTIERSYIQTFPKSFVFEGSKTNLEQTIGNSVPVNLGKFVAEVIMQYKKNAAMISNSKQEFIKAVKVLRPIDL